MAIRMAGAPNGRRRESLRPTVTKQIRIQFRLATIIAIAKLFSLESTQIKEMRKMIYVTPLFASQLWVHRADARLDSRSVRLSKPRDAGKVILI